MARLTHSSFFEYNLTRAYPYRWFTPVAIFGGLIAVVLISLLNFVSSGYTLAAQFSADPNVTVVNARLTKWPTFLTTRLQPSCSSSNIPLNTQLRTNNSALTYTLDSVVQNADQANRTLSSSLIYHNNLLPNCTITSIIMRMDTIGRTTAQIALSRWGIDARAYITCNLDTDDAGLSQFNLTAEYDYMPETVSVFSGFTAFVGRDKLKNTGLYWGESMLSQYWLEMAKSFESTNILVDNDVSLDFFVKPTQGFLSFTPNPNITDIKDPNFFDWLARFLILQPTGDTQIIPYEKLSEIENALNESSGQVFIASTDSLAKSLWSTVLTDLGQTHASPNILTDADLLTYFTQNFTFITNDDQRGQPSLVPYGSSQDTPNGPLLVRPSTLSVVYLCQIPQRKPVGNLILAILIADLVFLRALWAILTLTASAYVKSTDPRANLCEGCRQRDALVHNRPEEIDKKSMYSHTSLLPHRADDGEQHKSSYASGVTALGGGYGGGYESGNSRHSSRNHIYEMVPMESHQGYQSYHHT